MGGEGGGRWRWVEGEKKASKTKRGCLPARQAGNASLPGLSPSRCSLAVLPAHTRLKLTAPRSRGSPCAVCPSSPSFCLSLCYTLLSFIIFITRSLRFAVNLFPSFTYKICFCTVTCTFTAFQIWVGETRTSLVICRQERALSWNTQS